MSATETRAPAVDRTDEAVDVLRRHSQHSSAFIALNDETELFRTPGLDGLVAYRPAGRRHVVHAFGPFAAPGEKAALLDAFSDWSASQRRRVTGIQVLREDVDLYASRGFSLEQFGSSYSIDLDEYTLRGGRFMRTRNKISRARRLGVTVEEAGPEDPVLSELDRIDRDWLKGKGRHATELAFLVGQRGGRGGAFRRTFVARHEGRAVAYVTYSPVFGEQEGWLYDLTRRESGAPPGTIELIFSTAADRLREEGCRWLHLGMTPFMGLSDEHVVPGASVGWMRALIRQLGERGQAIYPARTQEAFKLKWAPGVIEPEYVAFQGRLPLGAAVQLLRLTRSIPI